MIAIVNACAFKNGLHYKGFCLDHKQNIQILTTYLNNCNITDYIITLMELLTYDGIIIITVDLGPRQICKWVVQSYTVIIRISG